MNVRSRGSILSGHAAAWRIALIYGLVGAAWVLFSDLLLRGTGGAEITRLTFFHTVKGLFFIVLSAVLLYLLVRAAVGRLTHLSQAVQRSEEGLAQAQQIAQLGSWEWDLTSGQIHWSREMYRIFGIDPGERPLTYEEFQPLVHFEDRARVVREVNKSLEQGTNFDVEYRIIRRDGVERHLHARGQAVRDAAGKASRLFGTVLDVTERKHLEQQLRRLNETLEESVSQRTAELRQANEDLRAFSYTISHDLRTRLKSIQSFARAIVAGNGAQIDDQVKTHARRIVAVAARMESLTSEILQYSQLSQQQLVPQRISLILLLHDVIGQLQRDSTFAHARIELREPMPWVLAHRNTLATVFANLLSNAAKFVNPDTTPQITIQSDERGGKVRIWVIDNGIGIPPERQERIFQISGRVNDTSAGGIGLAIVRRAVQRMGGQVGVESSPGQGSRFWVELPMDPQSP